MPFLKKDCLAAVFLVAAAILLTACGSTNVIELGPDELPPDIVFYTRNPNTVSSEEMRQFADAAVQDILNSKRFEFFLDKYREAHGPDALPVLKLARTINGTDDSALDTSPITDKLKEALFNSGKVNVSVVEGAEVISAIPDSGDIQYDDNFDPETVKKLAFQAASLVLVPKVVSNSVREGKTLIVTRTFTLQIAEVETGLLRWIFVKRLAFVKEKGFFSNL